MNYYNDNDKYAAQWLRNLMAAGMIPPGDVDDRSIKDVQASDLKGYIQCHLFAGLAGWAYALQLAGFPADRQVWTGSCPCQPFSSAGKQHGTDDPRHLWPEWFRLIRECKPELIFGEQVASAIGHGWLDLVFNDLESEGYTCGAAVLPACSVSAPHIRQRVWFVAQSSGAEWRTWKPGCRQAQGGQSCSESARSSDIGSLAYTECDGRRTDEPGRRQEGRIVDGGIGASSGMAIANINDDGQTERQRETAQVQRIDGASISSSWQLGRASDDLCNHWADIEWLPCRDGKARPTQPGIFPLAHGIPGRVAKLRAIGNAIVPQVAAVFIKAFMECCE